MKPQVEFSSDKSNKMDGGVNCQLPLRWLTDIRNTVYKISYSRETGNIFLWMCKPHERQHPLVHSDT